MDVDSSIANEPASGYAAPASVDPSVSTADIASLIREHHVAIYRYAYHLAGSVEDAEDLTQQTFLDAQRALAQLRDVERAEVWLLVILRRRFLKGLRKRRPVSASSVELDVDEIPSPAVEEKVDAERLRQAMNQLPDEHRVVLVEFYFRNASYQEIADRLELPLGTVMSRLSRAKGRLRALLLGEAEPLAANEPPTDRCSPRMTPR